MISKKNEINNHKRRIFKEYTLSLKYTHINARTYTLALSMIVREEKQP